MKAKTLTLAAAFGLLVALCISLGAAYLLQKTRTAELALENEKLKQALSQNSVTTSKPSLSRSPQPEISTATRSGRSEARRSQPPAARRSASQARKPAAKPVTKNNPAKPASSGRTLAFKDGQFIMSPQYKQHLIGPGFGQLINSAAVVPKMQGNALLGFEFKSIRPRSEFRKFGLKQGDIVRGVNGQRLVSTGQAIQLFQQLSAQNDFTVNLMRNGKPFSLKITVR